MSSKKIDKLFNDIPKVFGIADNILIVGFDESSRDPNERLEHVLCRCLQANLKLNKEKCLFRQNVYHFGEVVYGKDVSPDQPKLKALADMLLPKQKENCSPSLVL